MCKNILQLTAFYLSIVSTCCSILDTDTVQSSLKYVYRETWLNHPVGESSSKRLQRPVPYIMIDDFTNGGKDYCSNYMDCISLVRTIESQHRDKWDDIGYNFLIDGSGTVYEGKGWFKQGYVIQGFNHMCLSVGYIGACLENISSSVAEEITSGLNQLAALGTTLHLLHPDYRIITRSQIMYKQDMEMDVSISRRTSLSTPMLYDLISNHSHWFDGEIKLSVLSINTLLSMDNKVFR